MHFCAYLPTPAQCLMNYWTLRNLWGAGALCDWAADMRTRYPPEHWTDRVEAGSDNISTEWMMVIAWNIYTLSMRRGRRVWRRECGFYRLGLNLTPITLYSVILKAQQEERKTKDWERKEGREGRMEDGSGESWFGDIWLFAASYHKREEPSGDSDLPKDWVLTRPQKETTNIRNDLSWSHKVQVST